eukprot:CAMPEP_0184684806 /NCGR_PEP_ID=MMETSP0312-20130426/16788_1 /TAXON_ID=31354 /ORGANISM="Compsopogon coeruleus, Strain SAG 36.94" /LENGTH=55 /DNA_ID=CAMNT_0027138375 /DNA_START=272 /DNA_END=439 /DNA_ORIENTATION=-
MDAAVVCLEVDADRKSMSRVIITYNTNDFHRSTASLNEGYPDQAITFLTFGGEAQ